MLEIAIGIIFVFILVSTICTAIREGIEARLKTRAAYLEHGIRQLLNDADGKGLAGSLYNHPLIYGLFNCQYKPGKQLGSPNVLAKGGTLPSYIPAKNFSGALMDILARGTETNATENSAELPVMSLQTMRQNVGKIENPAVQLILLNAIDSAQGDLNRAQKNIENWFDSGMDRVSGWYKRSTQWIILWLALALTVLLNINTIRIVNYLAQNDTARKIVVAQATVAAKDTTSSLNYTIEQAKLDELKLPIGWDNGAASILLNPEKDFGLWNGIVGPLLGWLITALAATLGAPFWFDVLNKVMVIRSTVKPHEKSGEETSQDVREPAFAPQVAFAVPLPDARQLSAAGIHIDTPYHEPDACDVVAVDLTTDEDLPVSKGGIV